MSATPPPNPLNRVLVIQTAFIGDVILALGAVQQLKAAHPQAEIHLLVRKGNEGLATNHPDVHRIWIWDKRHKWASLRQLLVELRAVRPDAIVCLQRFFTMGLFATLLGAGWVYGFRKNPFARFWRHAAPHELGKASDSIWQHEIDRNAAVLAPLAPGPAQHPRVYPTPADEVAVAALNIPSPYVVLAPASVWYTKQWPEQRWAELLTLLPHTITPCLVGAPGDADLCNRLASHHPHARVLAGQLSLLQTAALMRNALRVVANDSAPLHLASAVNAPTTALFCSTLPQFGFGPLADDAVVLETPEPLACRPCGLHGKAACPEGHFRCGYGITAERVTQTMGG